MNEVVVFSHVVGCVRAGCAPVTQRKPGLQSIVEQLPSAHVIPRDRLVQCVFLFSFSHNITAETQNIHLYTVFKRLLALLVCVFVCVCKGEGDPHIHNHPH